MSVNHDTVVSVLGAGTMGGQIALSFALGGVNVSLWARRSESLAPALDKIAKGYEFLVDAGLAETSDREKILNRVTFNIPGRVSTWRPVRIV